MKFGFRRNHRKSFFDKAVYFFTKSEYTHAFMVIDDTVDGDAIVVESTWKNGVSLKLASSYEGRDIEYYEDLAGIWDINAIKPYIGHAYGYMQLLGIAIAKTFRLKNNPFPANEVCSELVLNWLLNSPYEKEFKHLNKDLVDPGEICTIFAGSPNFKRV